MEIFFHIFTGFVNYGINHRFIETCKQLLQFLEWKINHFSKAYNTNDYAMILPQVYGTSCLLALISFNIFFVTNGKMNSEAENHH